MITKIIDGVGLAEKIRRELKEKISQSRIKPGLAVILVGEDPASQIYVDFKKKASQEVGLYLETYAFEEDVKPKEVLELIQKLNEKKEIHGILVQLPLPDQFDEYQVIETISPDKDVDGFHPWNVGWLSIGQPRLISATARALEIILDEMHIEIPGKEAVIIGAGNITGKPIGQLLLNRGATVTVCHKATKDLTRYTQQADILISAVGKPGLIKANMVKTGAAVLDVGITRLESGKVVGDVDFDKVKDKAKYITPVPGGVGPLTVAMLLENTWQAMRRLEGYQD